MKKSLKIILNILFSVIFLVIGLFFGYKIAYNKYHKIDNSSKIINYDTHQCTFYAKIKNITDNIFLVEGLSVNDINFRGEFVFSVTEATQILWQGEKIELSDLGVGNNISITFDGYVLESYPGQINNIYRIQLLDDKK